jgi:hypothetical protein
MDVPLIKAINKDVHIRWVAIMAASNNTLYWFDEDAETDEAVEWHDRSSYSSFDRLQQAVKGSANAGKFYIPIAVENETDFSEVVDLEDLFAYANGAYPYNG